MATHQLVTKDISEKEVTLIFTTAHFKSWGKVAAYRAPWLRMGLNNIYCSAWKMGCCWYYIGDKEEVDKYKSFARGKVAKEFTGCKSVEKYSHSTRSTHHLFALFKKQHCTLLFWFYHGINFLMVSDFLIPSQKAQESHWNPFRFGFRTAKHKGGE